MWGGQHVELLKGDLVAEPAAGSRGLVMGSNSLKQKAFWWLYSTSIEVDKLGPFWYVEENIVLYAFAA